MRLSRQDLRQALTLAMPVMLAYTSIGIPCGVMEAQVGFTPLMALLFSASYYSGAGQFMIPNLWLAGSSLASIVLNVSLVTMRQLLYSTAFSKHLKGEGTCRTLGFAALVTDETFGINLERFSVDESWNASRGLAVNIACVSAWALANCAGAALGQVVQLPIDVMSFGMTAIFICLLVGQHWGRSSVVAAAVTACVVVFCKLAGLGGVAIFCGAVVGVVAGTFLVPEEGEVSA